VIRSDPSSSLFRFRLVVVVVFESLNSDLGFRYLRVWHIECAGREFDRNGKPQTDLLLNRLLPPSVVRITLAIASQRLNARNSTTLKGST
jgi:hypothetical protein